MMRQENEEGRREEGPHAASLGRCLPASPHGRLRPYIDCLLLCVGGRGVPFLSLTLPRSSPVHHGGCVREASFPGHHSHTTHLTHTLSHPGPLEIGVWLTGLSHFSRSGRVWQQKHPSRLVLLCAWPLQCRVSGQVTHSCLNNNALSFSSRRRAAQEARVKSVIMSSCFSLPCRPLLLLNAHVL